MVETTTVEAGVAEATTCVVPTCGVTPPAPPVDNRPQALRHEAELHRAKAVELERRADEIEAAANIERGPFLCAAHFKHLHHVGLRGAWAGSHLDPRADDALVTASVGYIERHPPAPTGACLACRPGSQSRNSQE
jgi:hypothetical protein